MLNAAVAESLKIYADRLEGADDFETALHEMIKKTIKDHKRIIFNGNGYDDAWIKEATKVRGLLNLRTTPDCIPELLNEKNVAMLTSHKVFSEAELESRCDIMLDNYCKTVIIEANTMADMAEKEIIPAVEEYTADLAKAYTDKKSAVPELSLSYEKKRISKLSQLIDSMDEATDELKSAIREYGTFDSVIPASCYIKDSILPKMETLRMAADEAETLTSEKYWPFPTYDKLLFGVK